MEQLDIRDIIRLVNSGRIASIQSEPTISNRDNWQVYSGEFKLPGDRLPFQILYFNSRATSDSITDAHKRLGDAASLHVVYAPSLDERTNQHHKLFKSSAKSFQKSTDYLKSFIADELETYSARLKDLNPRFYVDPKILTPIGTPKEIPNPLLNFFTDHLAEKGAARKGQIAVLLAEPGQGKTYMSQYLVIELLNKRAIPIYVQSEQWNQLAPQDLSSIWRTIVNSFRYFDAPIPWLFAGEEQFVFTFMKSGLSTLVFDGFDEYVLKNKGRVTAREVFDSLKQLSEEAGVAILITSRTSFWDAEMDYSEQELIDQRVSQFSIVPFDTGKAAKYFSARFGGDTGKALRATNLFGELRGQSKGFVGRGFVLNLVADLINRDGDVAFEGNRPVSWLLEALCEREMVRQQLPLSGKQQISVLKDIASEVAKGVPLTTETIELVIPQHYPLDESEVRTCVKKLGSHPLMFRFQGGWTFAQDQVWILLLADNLLDKVEQDAIAYLAAFNRESVLDAGQLNDLANSILAISEKRAGNAAYLDYLLRFRNVIERSILKDTDSRKSQILGRLYLNIAIRYIDNVLPKGSIQKERTELFLKLLGTKGKLYSLQFYGALANYDFRGVSFEECVFRELRWANCKFDEKTAFLRCAFEGGQVDYCTGFGSASFIDIRMDSEARALISSEQISQGTKAYTDEDLKSDVRSVLERFSVHGSVGFKPVKNYHLDSGTIRLSPHKNVILSEIKKSILELKGGSGGDSEGTFTIRDEAKEDARFFISNNMFTGELSDLFEKLKKKIGV